MILFFTMSSTSSYQVPCNYDNIIKADYFAGICPSGTLHDDFDDIPVSQQFLCILQILSYRISNILTL